MALRLAVARLLIADDVGVGKTIEAGLIAREFLDRGYIGRVAVLCPPYLCNQWYEELKTKFNIEASVILSSTIARLERQAPPDRNVFEYCRHFVASIDLVKAERYRASFLQFCPEFLIVDEVHGAARPPSERKSGARAQQQRHRLLCDLAGNPKRHLVLLTATPHSGVEESFRSILGLLNPDFEYLDLRSLGEGERKRLARHFVQRRRADVAHWLGEDTPFPKRDSEDAPYRFSPAYRAFYDDVYEFASGLVRSAESLSGARRRMRFWSALALLKCVSSSPAAAEVALRKRVKKLESEEIDELSEADITDLDAAIEPAIYDKTDREILDDSQPASVFDLQEQDPEFPQSDRRKLREFAKRAAGLRHRDDTKLEKLCEVIQKLLVEGFNPIVWCRFIATATYVADGLRERFGDKATVVAVTGDIPDDERRLKVESLADYDRRILVATDCLSEGINLQELFTAAIHYDLPWNPNRLEQREGRIDRFGQPKNLVKTVTIFGQDNPVDGAVLEVLLRKAREIYHSLGVRMPVPQDSESVMEAVLRSLFKRSARDQQVELFEPEEVKTFHLEWTRAAEREKISRTRFAQHAIKPEAVEIELKQTDSVLGSHKDVERFLVTCSQRIGFDLKPKGKGTWLLNPATLLSVLRQRLDGDRKPTRITFVSPTPENTIYVGRNHPLVEGLAEYLFDLAFRPPDNSLPVARCGVIRTSQVSTRTVLLLLRSRYLVRERGDVYARLAEEILVRGYVDERGTPRWLTVSESYSLLETATPTANVPKDEKREVLAGILEDWKGLSASLKQLLAARAHELEQSHRRMRKLIEEKAVKFQPNHPPDWLGVLVLLPEPKGVAR